MIVEPKIRRTLTGREYHKFVINIVEQQNGKRYENAFPIHTYGDYAQNLKIGDTVIIIGRLRNKRFLNENGNTAYYVYVLAQTIIKIKDSKRINLYNDKEICNLINDFNENFNNY